ncbi:MAG: DNA primase [Syntrophales bacterium]|nr:DNA primase [Syntrophales bacterium]
MKGHIPQEIIEEIRRRSNIVELVSQFVTLKKAGRNYVGLCPFHREKTPSFTVNPEKQIFYCFGCGEGGNEISFLMKFQDIAFPEAARSVAAKRGIVIPESEVGESKKKGASEREELLKVNRLAKEFFLKNILSDKGTSAREYLSQRGMGVDVINTFFLGYAPPGWRNLMNYLVYSKVSEGLLRKSGLLVFRDDGKSYDRFRARLIFPIESIDGDVIAFGGRELDGGEPKYLNSPESPIYIKGDNLYGLSKTRNAIRSKDFVIVVEGYFDLLSLWNAGITNAVATLGTALTKRQVSLIGRFTRNVAVLFDGDEGGRTAVERSLPLFLEAGMSARVVVLPEGSDPDDYVKRKGGEALTGLIDGAPSMVDYYIDSVIKSREKFDGNGRLAREIIFFIKNIPDVIQRNLFIKRASEKLGVDQQVIKDEVNRGSDLNKSKEPFKPSGQVIDPVELYLIYLMVEFPERIPFVRKHNILTYCTLSSLRKLGQRIVELYEERGTVTMSEAIDEAGGSDVGEHLLRLAMDDPPEDSIAERILHDTMGKIKVRWYRERRRNINQRLLEARESGDRLLCDRLLTEKEQLLKEEKTDGAFRPVS